jgi:DNA-binding MarR family transcriptional regulator
MSRVSSHRTEPGPHAVTLFDLGPGSGLPDAVRAFRLVLAAGQLLRTQMDARLRPDDLTTQQAVVLTAVTALGRPSVSDVAAAIGSTRQNVTQLVTALERKGMLRLDDDPADNRRRVLTTTRLSDDYWERRNAGDYDALAEWFGMLDQDELHELCDALGRVVAGRQSASR